MPGDAAVGRVVAWLNATAGPAGRGHGFGFVKPAKHRRLFVSGRDLRGCDALPVGQMVRFVARRRRDGHLIATEVAPIGNAAPCRSQESADVRHVHA
jgi:hypothetical protein